MSDAPNPFSSRFVKPGALQYCTAGGTSVAAIDQRFKRLPRCQIVGGHGTGKSTLIATLLTLQPSCSVRQLQLHSGDGLLIRIQAGWSTVINLWRRPVDLEIIDGAEQCPIPLRWLIILTAQLLRRRLLLTAHRPLVGLAIVHRTEPNPTILKNLLGQLLGEDADAQIRALDAAKDFAQVANVRDYFADLYERYERQRV